MPLARLALDPELMQQAMEQAADELRAMEDRYSEFDAIAKAIRLARERVETAA